MSSVNNGVQQNISDKLGRNIVYVHCYNHQLHLVVFNVTFCDLQIFQTLTIAEQLYVFFKRLAVGTKYINIDFWIVILSILNN